MSRVTVCIAAACRNGEFDVTCTDGALSADGQTFDLAVTKMTWFDDWQIMYAGEPSNADLILENIRQVLHHEPKALARENIQSTLRRAYKARFAQWTADYVLAPYNMEMDEFKRKGRKILTDEVAARLAREMSTQAVEFKEELMIVGWGKAPHSIMIFGMNQAGSWSGSITGIGTIGAGADVARSTLLMHGITRNSTLEEALYGVAVAKFSAERCEGVGRNTTIHVSRRRNPNDKARKVGDFLTPAEVRGLRRVWMQHGRVRIPDDAYPRLIRMSQRISGGVSFESFNPLMRSIARRSRGQQ